MSSNTRIAVAGVALSLVLAAGLFVAHRGGDGVRTPELRELARHQFDLREGILYAKGESEAFNGTLAETFPGGAKRIAIVIRDGGAHGVSRGWYENGQLEVEENFVRGVSHGRRTRWHANGATKSEARIVDGAIEGVFTRWHDNGQKAAVAIMVDGVSHGVSEAWHASGARKSRVVLEAGEVVSSEFFEDVGASQHARVE